MEWIQIKHILLRMTENFNVNHKKEKIIIKQIKQEYSLRLSKEKNKKKGNR